MKILVLSNLYPPDCIGGYELLCAQAVDALQARGHQIQVLTAAARKPVPTPSHVARDFRLADIYDGPFQAQVPAYSRHTTEIESRYISAFNVHVLLQHLERFRPDVVYLHNLVGLGGLGLLGCLKHQSSPWVWHLGDAVPYHLCSSRQVQGFPTEEYWGRPVPGLVEAFSREIEGTYICCSDRLAAEIAGYGIQLRGSMNVIPYWFDCVRPGPRAGYFRDGKLRIVCAGALGAHKGTDILIEAAAALRDGGRTNFTVDLYGTVDSPTWQLLIDKLDLRAHVRLHGWRLQAELSQAYRTCDLSAFPTWRREPFGVAPLEAAAQGCVPILSESCGIAEWMVDGVDCLKAKRTIEGFRDVIANVMDGKIDLKSLGARASDIVWRDFHLDAIIPSIEGLLLQVARAPRRSPRRPAEAYSIALMAEKMAHVVGQQTLIA